MSITNRVREQAPTADWGSLQLLLDEKKAAHLLGTSLSYLRRSRSEGMIRGRTPAPPFVYVGNRVYYRTADLKAWVEGLAGRTVT